MEGRVKVGGRREKEQREREKKKAEGLIKLYWLLSHISAPRRAGAQFL